MGKHIDIGYFKKPVKVRAKVAKERTVINKMYAWELGKEYYDGARAYGYGGYKYDGRWKVVAEAIVERYGLKKGDKVLYHAAAGGVGHNQLVPHDLAQSNFAPAVYAVNNCTCAQVPLFSPLVGA